MGRERSPPAWSQRVWRGKAATLTDSLWLMMCRSCPAPAAAAREHLDDDHAGATAGAWGRQHTRAIRRDIRLLLRLGSRRDDTEQRASRCDALGAVGGRKEAVVADAVEALGQHVQQEAPDELVRVQPHRLPAARAVGAIVLPAERNRGVVGCNEAAVRDGDTVRVTGEIAQDLFWSRERRLIDRKSVV